MTVSFVAPNDPTGRAALYGKPPWQFFGRSITVFARCDPAGIAALTPAPLHPQGDPVVRFSLHDLTCDLGHGWDWAQANPAAARFREATIGIGAIHGDLTGFWDPFLWTDSDAELAVGREFYGWPQRFGSIAMGGPHSLDGWRIGDRASGLVSRHGEAAFRLAVDIAASTPADVSAPPFQGFFLERILPDPVDLSRRREVFFAAMSEVRLSDIWSGAASLTLCAPELAILGTPEPLAGQVHAVAWTKNRAQRLWSETIA
jgi:acetoacetate decarboxylase